MCNQLKEHITAFNSRNSQDSNISTMNDMKLYEVRKADEPIYSRKVFVGGLPRDFNASELFFSAWITFKDLVFFSYSILFLISHYSAKKRFTH